MTDAQHDQSADGRATIARLTDEILPRLIARLTNSELGELEVREDGWRIRLRRPLVNGTAEETAARQPHPVMAPGAHATSRAPGHGASRETPRGLVASPAVGYFAPRAGVDAGTRLRSGDLLGHIDVLGVRHDVVSPIDGALRAFEVESGQAVEYGQPIARVEAET